MGDMTVEERTNHIIQTPEELRRFLLDFMVKVAEGKRTVSQANSVIGLTTEVHKSIRQQWDMHCYAAENLSIVKDRVLAHDVIEGEAGELPPT